MTQPNALSKDDYQALADVRRAIWSNAVVGTGAFSQQSYARK
jgi:hypothetical protein